MDTIDEENETINEVAFGQGTTELDIDGGIRRGDADEIGTCERGKDDPGPGGSTSGGIASNVEAGGGGDGLERYRKKARKRTSVIWEHIAEIKPGKDGKRRAQCKLCQQVFQMSKTSSTTTLKRHLELCKSGHGIQSALVLEEQETSEGTTEAEHKLDVVVKLLKDLYEEYVSQFSVGGQVGGGIIDYSSLSSHGTSGKSTSSGKAKFRAFKKQSEIERPKASELDVYLDDDIEDVDEESDESFDALNWWKANGHKYQILSRMVADILAIPMSTVASESAFSAGGRVIDPYRASLKPETVEMLICGGDYI